MGAVLYRRRPEIHKRLILLATTALLFAAVGRMTFLSRQENNLVESGSGNSKSVVLR